MTHWDAVKDLFLAAAELPPAARARFLDESCTGDPLLRQELDRLFEADSKNGEAIISAIEGAAQSLFSGEGIIDSRIGAYRIAGEIGCGGMGNVYLAVRADDHYRKKVAIKLIRRGMDTEDMLDRFRHERQILANLEHPFIARLLDGGTAPDGRPFLVMEYVEGEPLDTYCRVHDLDLRQRCRLFLKVCEAVAYAHRSLVVHRDLKPGNILVSGDGSPKLLDFGVAKLLDPDSASGRTAMAGLRPLTPDYASPELIRGEPITTAADVYALGAILYELLSGERAQRFSTYGLREVERVICEVDPPRLSEAAPRWQRHLQGDLDAIVAMAMRKEPALRYATVEQLAADLERYLNGWPVAARQGSFAYRARKFVRRHRVAIAASELFAIALIAGATAAAIQANRATREQAHAERERIHALASQARAEASRKEAEQAAAEAQRQRGYAEAQRRQAELQGIAAETERQVADRRFEQVRQLAGKFLLDFHEAIVKLPGSTPARKMVVETGLQYYDTLVREAHGNRELLEEIARGYDRLGDVQGNPYSANLGDTTGALASYRKAEALRAGISDPSPEFLRDRIQGNVKIVQLLNVKGDVKSADRILRDTITFGQKGPAASAYVVREALANAYGNLGDLSIRTGDYRQCIEPYTIELSLYTQLARENRNRDAERTGISLAHTKLGETFARLERGEESLTHLHMALEIDKELLAADPESGPRARKLYFDYHFLGFLFLTREQLAAPGEVMQVLEAQIAIADRMATADPSNNTALIDVAVAYGGLGDWLHKHGDFEKALVPYRKSLDAVEKMAASTPPSLVTHDAMIQANQRLGTCLADAGQLDEALTHFATAEEHLRIAGKQNPGLSRLAKRQVEIEEGRAHVYISRQNWDQAIAAYEGSIAIAEDLWQRDPKSEELLNALPDMYVRLANCYAGAAHWSRATQTIETALARLDQIRERRALLSDEEKERQEAVAKLAAWNHR